jgi:RNA polymerase sigma-70 factor (ECF subfamily)
VAGAAAAGDVEAFEQLYRSHVGRVYALCLRMVRDAGEAEELTQQTFVRAWERLGSFRGDSAFSTWLHRVAVNVVIGSLRARGRWRERFSELPDPELHEAPPPAFAQAADVDLERAIATLSPRARLIFVLHDVEGYKHAEIARLTGLAVGTSKAHLHRARRLLREELAK